MSYSKNGFYYIVECKQQDDSWREVYSATKQDDAYKYMRDFKNYALRVRKVSYRKNRHHGLEDFYERS